MRIADIIAAIERVAPRTYQEDWDNSGLQVGNAAMECTGVLITVDATPAVIAEAKALGCNLVVSHHPLIFKGLKRLTGSTPVEVAVMNAVADGISVYSSHTALDNAPGGVSHAMAAKLGLRVLGPLSPSAAQWMKLVVYVPESDAESVRMAMFDAGAGSIGGHYDCCSFNTDGTGTFQSLEGANPHVGAIGELHEEVEVRMEVAVPTWKVAKVVSTMLEVHPYECPAYELLRVANDDACVGSGVYGVLDDRLTARELIAKAKTAFNAPVARCSNPDAPFPADAKLSRVALCGGAGGSFIEQAIGRGAQAYISADLRYHDFVDYADRILLIDLGHFETEQCTKEIFANIISGLGADLPVHISGTADSPVSYL